MTIESIKCTAAETGLLKTAIQQRLAAKLLRPSTIEDMQLRLRCTTETAMMVIIGRIKEYCSGMYQTMQQLGINVTPDNTTLQQICVGMGVSLPTPHQVPVTDIARHNPQDMQTSALIQLFLLYVETIGDIPLIFWNTMSFEHQINFANRSGPYITQLHNNKLMLPVIQLINDRLPPYLEIRPIGLTSHHTEDIAASIFKAFSHQTADWCRYLASDLIQTLPVEADSVDNLTAIATTTLDLAQKFATWIMVIYRNRSQWAHWIEEFFTCSEGFTKSIDRIQVDNPRFFESSESRIMVIIAWLANSQWNPFRITMEELQLRIDNHINIELISLADWLSSLARHAAFMRFNMTEDVSNMLLSLSPLLEDRNTLIRMLSLLTTAFEDQINELDYQAAGPLFAEMSELFSTIEWLVKRKPMNIGTDTLTAFLLSQPQRPIVEDIDEDRPVLYFPILRSMSLGAKRNLLSQPPSRDSCSETDMTEFTSRIRQNLLTLVETSLPQRCYGLVSTCDNYQYALYHMIKNALIRSIYQDRQRSVLCIGNSSGLLARLSLATYPQALISHISCDNIIVNNEHRTVYGPRGLITPPELQSAMRDLHMVRRLHLVHGTDGDLTSATAMTNSNMLAPLSNTDLQTVFVDLTCVPSQHQLLALKNILLLLHTINQINVPLSVLWAVNNMDMNAVYKALSLGLRSTVEIVGAEYLCMPTMLVTIQVTAIQNISRICTLPLSIRTAIEATILDSSAVTIGPPHEMFLAVTAELGLLCNITLEDALQTPGIIASITGTCSCTLLDSIIGQLALQSGRSYEYLFTRYKGEKMTLDEARLDLELIGSYVRSTALEICLQSAHSIEFLEICTNKMRNHVHEFLNNTNFVGQFQVYPLNEPIHVRQVTRHHHSLLLGSRQIVLSVGNSRLDLLGRFNQGIASGFDILHKVCAVQIATVDPVNTKGRAYANMDPKIAYNICCENITREQAILKLNQAKLHIQSWMNHLLQDIRVRDLPAMQPMNERSPIYRERRPDEESSPEYFPESPVYNGNNIILQIIKYCS